MEYTEFKMLFDNAMRKNALESLSDALSDEQTVRFYRFANHLLQVNQTMNLTAIRDLPDVITKHFVDSLLSACFFSLNATVLDLGCGAGFPSIPLAIARPDLHITALDSTGKKIAFVQSAAELLGLDNLSAVTGRAEEPVLRSKLGQFDFVTSRAVARLNVLSELCLPYVKVGGKFLPLKAAKADEELAEAQKGIAFLGGGAPIAHPMILRLDSTEEPRCIIEIEKQKETPKGYPRAYGAILKRPL